MSSPTRRTAHPGQPRARRGLLITALVCALIAALALGAMVSRAATQPQPAPANDVPAVTAPPPSSVASPSASTSAAPTPADRTRSPKATKTSPVDVGLDESVPTRLRIPTIKVDASFVDLRLNDDGTLQTPDDPDQVGWFTGAHTPGAAGVAVVAGHVTWNRRPTVFFDLGRLHRNDQISIDRQDGTKATFAVRRISTFPKDSFPTDEVYRPTTNPKLVLITCGGTYDEINHSYAANVIVWADLVATAR